MATRVDGDPLDLVENRKRSKREMDVAGQYFQCSLMEGVRILGMPELGDIASKCLAEKGSPVVVN